jgi:hypothetical protein
MPVPSKFIPAELLTVPGFFGEQEDVTWILAHDLEGAIRLAWAREQHELALLIHLRRVPMELSIPDVAARLGVMASDLRRKLKGRFPAQMEDLYLWCWYLDEPRRNFRPEDLLTDPTLVSVPRLR